MVSAVNADGLEPSVLHRPVRSLLEFTRTLSPILLLTVFGISFIAHSIISARKVKANAAVSTGPGGRPLPKRMRSTATAVTSLESLDFSPKTKIAIKWLSVGILFTFVADAAINMSHVILFRQDHWWCGQAVVVGCAPFCCLQFVM